jgi:glycosyltransferase involved in cell wall biosynthesis
MKYIYGLAAPARTFIQRNREMKIGIFHGYELIGSGSNQATSYLAKALAQAGHEVHLICREPSPERIDFIDRAIQWDPDGKEHLLFQKNKGGEDSCILHQLPLPPVNAVYITDTQRPGNVKAFSDLTDEELSAYHRFVANSLRAVLMAYPVEILHNNHLVYQPVVAAEVCGELGIPYIIYPRGSAIEYTVNHDKRYRELARGPVLSANGIITGNREVRDRIISLYPEHRDEILANTQIVGIGVDTTLFSPVEKGERKNSVDKIFEYAPFGGKSPELTQKLYSHLDSGEIDAITGFREAYQSKQPDCDLVQKLENIPWDSHILVFVGATIAGKGLQALIVSLPFILKKHPDAHLLVVGSGASRELFEALVYAIAKRKEPLLDTLIEKGFDFDPIKVSGPWSDVQFFLSDREKRYKMFENGSNLMDHVHFLGRLDHKLLRYLFPCADVGFFPSIIPEAYGNVLFESLSNGVLPMASYFTGLACGLDDLVPHLGQDLVDLMKIPVEDDKRIKGLIKNLDRILSYEDLATISKRLRSIAVENFDWNIRARQMTDAYKKCT